MARLVPLDLLMVSTSAHRMGVVGALGTLAGIALSGPIAVGIVSATRPQPPWSGADVFSAHYHPLQLLPYAGGLLLVVGLLVVVACAHALADEGSKANTSLGILFASVFATMIFGNYTIQSAFIPVLVREGGAGNAALIAALSMSNPRSLAWALEMWGWGFCGAATWCIAPVFASRWLRRVAFANAVVSIAGALLTSAAPGWVLTAAGIAAFLFWNALLCLLALLWLAAFRGASRSTGASLARAVPRGV